MKKILRKAFHTFVPANFHDVFGLAYRLIVKGDSAGRMAMVYSFMAVVLSPVDLMLLPFEKRLYKNAPPPEYPLIFVCGPPRSGTTVMAQTLIRFLPVYYFNNLTSIFPRSPLMACRLFGWMAKNKNDRISTQNFYGRTTKLFQPNDALYFWDRWNGSDRKIIPSSYDEKTQQAMRSFFGAVVNQQEQALLNKNNSLNTFANLVAEILPNARFVCLDRDPVYLVQSHLQARRFIHGSEKVAYGIRGYAPDGESPVEDPIEDVCRQVMFHRRMSHKMADLLGPERFLLVNYSDFCEEKGDIVAEIANRFLGLELDPAEIENQMPPIRFANKQKVDDETFSRITETIARLEAEQFKLS